MDNDDFIEWANENIIVVLAHQDDGHKPEKEESKDGESREVCPLYPGLTCEQHKQAGRDLTSPPEGLPKIEAPEGVPSSWFIAPTGETRKLNGASQQSAGKVQDEATEWQKALGDHLTLKKWDKLQVALKDADAAVEKGDWKAALKAIAVPDGQRKKLPEGLVTLVDERVKALGEKVAAAWAEVRDGEGDLATKQKAAKDLLGKIAQRLSSGPLPVKAEIDEWLKANK